jgi:thiol-disulfide isomerase/thioredoxin
LAAPPAGGAPSGAEPEGAEPSGAEPEGAAEAAPPRRSRRVVLWVALAAAVVIAALVAVIASAQPSSEVNGQSTLLGHPAPPISGPGLDGGRYTLRELRGKWVLVNFMATWCPPCRQEMPQLLAFARQHARSADAVVLTVVDDPSNAGQLRAYLAAEGAHWPAVDDPAATVSYGLSGLPSSFLVAPDGTVFAYLLGEVRASEVDRWIRDGVAKGFGPA